MCGEVILFAQYHRQSATRSVAGDADTIDAAADDQDIASERVDIFCLSHVFHGLYKTRLRICVTAISVTITIAKMDTSTVATRGHWNRFNAVSSTMPIPPAPTMPSTADSRTLISQRNRMMDRNDGFSCGQ